MSMVCGDCRSGSVCVRVCLVEDHACVFERGDLSAMDGCMGAVFGWMDGGMDAWMDGVLDREWHVRMQRIMDGWFNGKMHRGNDEMLNASVVGWKDGWVAGWMEAWMHGCVGAC